MLIYLYIKTRHDLYQIIQRVKRAFVEAHLIFKAVQPRDSTDGQLNEKAGFKQEESRVQRDCNIDNMAYMPYNV